MRESNRQSENQLYTSFRNEQALSTNLHNCTNQDRVFDLEKYGPYIDKIRAFLVPSLEYRVHSLLEEFVYSTNSRWTRQFPCFKKFIDVVATWKDPLNRAAEYNIGTMDEMMRNTIKHIIEDDLITCFLDSVILHHRLNKVCCKLDALNIEENILRSWNFVNERNYLLNCNCFMDFSTTMDCSMNLNTIPCNAKESIKYKKAVKKKLGKNVYNKSIKHNQPTMLEYRGHQRILDSNQNFFQQNEDNSNNFSACVATGSQNNNINKINRSFHEKSCNIKFKKIRNGLKLKIIVHKAYLEDYKCSTFSSLNITRLPLPCKPSNLIKRIFEADPSLTESCLIVIKQKFENSMYNVCSCLNNILEKLNTKLTKALYLNCEIHPGYISFRLKARNIKKCFFVARIPICQKVRKCTIQQNYSILSSKTNSKPSTEIIESKCFEQYKNDDMSFNDTFKHIDEETEKFDTCCLQLDQSFITDVTTDIPRNEAESNNEKKITCMSTENISRHVQNLAISSCNNSCKDIIGGICNATSCADNSKERDEQYCNNLGSIEINCDDVEKCKKNILELSNSITKTQSANNVNYMYSSYKNLIKTNDDIDNIFSNKDLASFSQTTSTNEYDWICSSNKKLNSENKVCNTCSIMSFVQNSECDKQLVELNYNHSSNNDVNVADERFENNSSLQLTKVGCNSCSCQRNDIIDITVNDNISRQNIVCLEASQCNFNAVKAQSTDHFKMVQVSSRNNDLLTISNQMPRSTLSKGINVDTNSYSQTVRLTSDDDRNVSTVMKTSDRCDEIAHLSTALIVPKKGNEILPEINKENFDVKEGMQDFITSKRFSTSKRRFRSDKDSRNSSFSTGEYLCMGNHSMCATSNASLYYRSFVTTSELTINNKRDEFQKSDKSKKLSKLCGHGYVRSRNDIHNVISTTIKHKFRRYPNEPSTELRPQTLFTMTKFRNSVDKSVDKIKHLIHAKLSRILFNNKISSTNKSRTKTFWRNGESSENTRRKKTSDKHIRQGYNITTCSTCNCCRQDYTISSREPSNTILSLRRTKGKRRSKENIKLCDHKLTDSSKNLLSFRSSKTSPWFYDLLTYTTEDIEKQKLNRSNRYNRKKKIRNAVNYNKNYRCNFKHSGTSITISSHSIKASFTENDSKFFRHYTCERQKKIRNNKRICKQDQCESDQVRHKYEQYENIKNYRDVPIKYTDVDSNESLKTSHTWRENARNIYQQFYDVSEIKNIKRFASLRKDRQIFKKDVSNRSDSSLRPNDNLRKRHIFAILTDAYNDCIDDLDLDFKLRLLRYVELCKSIKRSLIKTLQLDDMCEVNTASVSNSAICERV